MTGFKSKGDTTGGGRAKGRMIEVWGGISYPQLPRLSCKPLPIKAPADHRPGPRRGPDARSPAAQGSAGPPAARGAGRSRHLRAPSRQRGRAWACLPLRELQSGPCSPPASLSAGPAGPPGAGLQVPERPALPAGEAQAPLRVRSLGGVGNFRILALRRRGGDGCGRDPLTPPRGPEVWGPGRAGRPRGGVLGPISRTGN